MEEKQIKGYIVKLYKKMDNAPKKATIRDAMFMIWMNFDCMDVFPVQKFSEFSKSIEALDLKERKNRKSIKALDLKEREKYESRQKLFLYPIGKNQGLLQTSPELKDLPLVTLTVLYLEKNEDHLKECAELCLKDLKQVKGQLYGSLSVHDRVLVLRGSSYAQLETALFEFRSVLKRKGALLYKTYTIAGLDLRYLNSWKQEEQSSVSIRLSCDSQLTAEYLKENEKLKAALQDGYQVYPLLGKYDYDILGKIRDTKKFTELFLEEGALSPASMESSVNIQKTNTRFLSLGENQETEASEKMRNLRLGKEKDASEELDAYLAKYSKLDKLSPSIRQSLLRLILRLFQSCITIHIPQIREDLRNTMECFLEFLCIHQDEAESRDEFGQMMNCLNLLLDNRVTVGMSDFETPQNVLRYSGASLRVLLAYSGFVKQLFSILQYYKSRKGEKLQYVDLVTADTGTKVTATVFLSYCSRYRFINVNIPVDLLFEVQHVLPWLTHEVGHFLRAGWDRYDRNQAYFWSVSRAVLQMLKPYISTEGTQGARLAFDMEWRSDGNKFDAYRESVYEFYSFAIGRCIFDYNKNIQIPFSRGRDLFEKTKEITKNLQKVYEESIADIFMIQTLKIDSLMEYLEIQSAYYKNINVTVSQLPLVNISRIVAVSVVMEGLDGQDYKGIKKHFRDFYVECVERAEGSAREVLPIAELLKEYRDYYMIEPLVEFLRQKVERGLKQLLLEETVRTICWNLRENYHKMREGEFTAFLDFLDKFYG